MRALLRGLVVGMGLGLVWGVVARVFMRLLTTTPSFSWSGTLFILGLAAVAGACLGLVHAARVAGRSRWWRLAALPALALFAGPGIVLPPATIGMAMVLRGGRVVRVSWRSWSAVRHSSRLAGGNARGDLDPGPGVALMVLSAAARLAIPRWCVAGGRDGA